MSAGRPPRGVSQSVQSSKNTLSDVEEFPPPDSGNKSPLKEQLPTLTYRRSSHTRKMPPTHIPRPRNPFIIFRSEFCERQKMKETGIESDHRHISRIAAHVWNNLLGDKKESYKAQAEAEKQAHMAAHPHYRFSPVERSTKIKRKPKTDNTWDVVRCRQLAELVISGVEGRELQHTVKLLDEGLVQVELTDRTAPKVRRGGSDDLNAPTTSLRKPYLPKSTSHVNLRPTPTSDLVIPSLWLQESPLSVRSNI